jgi:SUKH-3 immunity protein of toxin-antitoxin system
MTTLSPRSIEELRSKCRWSEEYRWRSEPELAEGLRELGYAPNAAALRFLWRYGGLYYYCRNPKRSSDPLLFHTDGIEAAHLMAPIYCEQGAELAGSMLCPIGACGYGDWLLAMSEDGDVWGLDMIRQWREIAESGEDLLKQLT